MNETIKTSFIFIRGFFFFFLLFLRPHLVRDASADFFGFSGLTFCLRIDFIFSFTPLLPFATAGSCLPCCTSCSAPVWQWPNTQHKSPFWQPSPLATRFYRAGSNFFREVWLYKASAKWGKWLHFNTMSVCFFHNMENFTRSIFN